jgi:peroxiredoxin
MTAATMFAQKAFGDYYKINYPLLSGGRDITVMHKMLRAYGVFDEDKAYRKTGVYHYRQGRGCRILRHPPQQRSKGSSFH